MSKGADLAKTSTKAGFNYLWGLVISTVISSLGTIALTLLIDTEIYALYGLALTVPTVITLFRDWGINHAIIRYTAQYRAEKREAEIRSIFIAGVAFEIALGLILSIVSFLMADYIATTFYARPEITILIQIASFSILVNGVAVAATAVFTGTEKTTYNSVMLICQSTAKTLLIIGMVMAGFGTIGAVTGFTLSCVLVGLIGLVFIIHLYRKIPKNFTYKLELKEYLKEMLKYATPLSISTIITGFLAQAYVPIYGYFFKEENTLLGNYFIALNFVVLISFFAIPITNMLFPAFSKLDIKKDKTTLKNVFQSSVKYFALIVVPVAAIVMCLATPAVTTIYANDKPSAPLFLALLSISYLFSATGNLSVSNIINSQGKTGLNLKFALITAAIGFPLGVLLIKYYGIFGLIATSIFAPIPSLILSLIWVKKHYELTVDWVSSAKILLSAAITAIFTYLIVNYIPRLHTIHSIVNTILHAIHSIINTIYPPLSTLISETTIMSTIQLGIGTIFFIITFTGIIILTKTLSIHDINNLQNMTTNIGPITKIVHITLNTMEKIMKKLKLI